MIKECYRCGNILTEENKSYEHVIPNSIGGKLGSFHLLCKDCNNFYGREFDSEISRQISIKAHVINIKTDRPLPEKVTAFTQDGKEVGFAPGLKPLDKVTLKLGDRRIDFFMKSNVVQSFINRKNKEMAKKGNTTNYIPYTNLPGERVFFKNNLSSEIGNAGFGGKLYFKAISRIAVNFYLMHSDNINLVKDIILELEDPSKKPRARFYYSDTSLLISKGQDEISHTIVLKGEPSKRILYAYIDLFGCHSHLVNLSAAYDGPELNLVYSYDCIEGCEIKKDEWLYITRPELTDYHLLNHERLHHFSIALHKKAHDNFWRIVENLQKNK